MQKARTFEPGDKVLTHSGGSKIEWVPGWIQSVTGPLSYVVRLSDNRLVKRHVDHIRKRYADVVSSPEMDISTPSVPRSVVVPSSVEQSSAPVSRSVEVPDSPGAPVTEQSPAPPEPAVPPIPRVQSPAKLSSPETPGPRRSGRNRKAPDRYGWG